MFIEVWIGHKYIYIYIYIYIYKIQNIAYEIGFKAPGTWCDVEIKAMYKSGALQMESMRSPFVMDPVIQGVFQDISRYMTKNKTPLLLHTASLLFRRHMYIPSICTSYHLSDSLTPILYSTFCILHTNTRMYICMCVCIYIYIHTYT